jgi:hypothetical protein
MALWADLAHSPRYSKCNKILLVKGGKSKFRYSTEYTQQLQSFWESLFFPHHSDQKSQKINKIKNKKPIHHTQGG